MIQINFKKCAMASGGGVTYLYEIENYPSSRSSFLQNVKITIKDGICHVHGELCEEHDPVYKNFKTDEDLLEYCKSNSIDIDYAKEMFLAPRKFPYKGHLFNSHEHSFFTTKFSKTDLWFNNFYIKQ